MPFKQLAIIFVSLLFLSSAHAQTVEPASSVELLAPYRIEKVVDGTVVIDFGEKDPSPQQETLKEMTIVTPNRTFLATLSSFDKECVSLCGDVTDPTCHFVGIYALEATLPESGEPIVALSGRPVIEDLSMITMKEVSTAPEAQDWVSPEYTRGFRWRQDDQNEGKVYLERYDRIGMDFYRPRIELASCGVQDHEPFTLLRCPDVRNPSAALLYKERELLIASFADYSNAAADLVAEFNFGGNTHYLVKIGLKAHAVIGILQPSGDSWEILLRPKDYPTMC